MPLLDKMYKRRLKAYKSLGYEKLEGCKVILGQINISTYEDFLYF